MRANPTPNRVNIITLGCSKNVIDSEVLMGQLKANQREVVHEKEVETNDIVVVNTCGFIENAKEESINTILDCVNLKEEGKIDKLYVMGCLSERYKSDLQKEIPQVDKYFGSREVRNVLRVLRADYKQELVGERLLTTPMHYAYLKISEGCDRKCSFCAIPLMRGKHESKSIEDLVTETKSLVEKGVKEIMIIAQELTYYGIDLYGERRISDLLNELSKVEGLEWIKLHYAYPSGFPEDLLHTIANNPKVCNYLDIPLQHIVDPVLKSMRRGSTKAKTTALIEKAREIIPNLTLRTTLIVGYPGETEEHFQEMVDWIQEVKFDRLGAFTYSHEENTHAYEQYEDTVSEEEKQERLDRLMEAQHEISEELNQRKVNQIYRVLIDEKVENGYLARTEGDSPDVDNSVWIKTEEDLNVGDFAEVKIIEADAYDLTAILN